MSRLSTGIANEPATLADRVVTLATASNTTITPELHAGKLVLLSSISNNIVLNLPVARGTGDVYSFLNTVTRTSGTIIINASTTSTPSNFFVGSIQVQSVSNLTTSNITLCYNSTTSDVITLNITTTGGGVGGDYLSIIDGAPARWYILSGVFVATANATATPFSG